MSARGQFSKLAGKSGLVVASQPLQPVEVILCRSDATMRRSENADVRHSAEASAAWIKKRRRVFCDRP